MKTYASWVCILVLKGAMADGVKELLVVVDGERESKLSRVDLLQGLKAQGLKAGPVLAVGGGAFGFWAAVAEEYPGARERPCWVHKTATVLDKLSKTLQPAVKDKIHLFGARQEVSPQSLRGVAVTLRTQVPQGLRVTAQGQG